MLSQLRKVLQANGFHDIFCRQLELYEYAEWMMRFRVFHVNALDRTPF